MNINCRLSGKCQGCGGSAPSSAGAASPTSTGIRTKIVADKGQEAAAAVERAAARIQDSLAGATVTLRRPHTTRTQT